jgi:serine/threonine protein kinase
VSSPRGQRPGGPPSGGAPISVDTEPLAADSIAAGDDLGSTDRMVRGPGLDSIETVDTGASALDLQGVAERYRVKTLLGQGGMGEVRLCRDATVGRDVAMKVLNRTAMAEPDGPSRFIREARVQGQLEHPAVVPVYDLGIDAEGSIYFTMKRVRGLTLLEILRGLRKADPAVVARYSRRRLLTAFHSVCLAVDFAHSRGVLHRDLKPANVMLGDFGEVHLLDWGVAKVIGNPAGQKGQGQGRGEDAEESIDTGPSAMIQTRRGEVLGSPGYISPEAIRGKAPDRRSDVYGLGVILFEMLTLTRLHDGQSNEKVLASTLMGAEARPSVRAPEAAVPPELEAMCVRATALEPADRYPTAGDLARDLEQYLDGDRDLEQRRRMAEVHSRAAEAAAAAAWTSGSEGREARSQALRELGQVLALDPGNARAVTLLTRLLLVPPAQAPPEVEQELTNRAALARQRATSVGVLSYVLWLLFAPVIVWMGVRNRTAFAVSLVLVLASLAVAVHIRWRGNATIRRGLVLLVVSSLAIGSLSMLLGPFVVVPLLGLISTGLFSMYADRGPSRVVAMLAGAAIVMVPLALEWAGVLEPSYSFQAGGLLLHPRMIQLPEGATVAFLVLTTLVATAVPTLLLARVRDELHEAERRLLLQAWQLKQLVPDEARLLDPK